LVDDLHFVDSRHRRGVVIDQPELAQDGEFEVAVPVAVADAGARLYRYLSASGGPTSKT